MPSQKIRKNFLFPKNVETKSQISSSMSPSDNSRDNQGVNANLRINNYQKDNLFHLLKRRWLTVSGVTVALTASAFWWISQQSPLYQGKFLLLVDKNQVQEATQNLSPDNINNINTSTEIDYSTEIQILGSATVLSPILQQISAQYPDIYEKIDFQNLENLDIRQIDKTKIIEVVFRDEDPEKIKFVLSAIASNYIENKINNLEQNSVSEGLNFINNRIPPLEKKISSLHSEIEKLRKEFQFIDPQVKATELTQQLLATEKEYFATKVQLEEAKSVYDNLKEQLKMSPEDAITLTYLTESSRYQGLLKQLQEIEIELANQSAIFTDESPQIISLKERKENITELINEEIKKYPLQNSEVASRDNNFIFSVANPSEMRAKLTNDLLNNQREIDGLNSKIVSLEKILQDLNKRINNLPTVTKKYTELKRDLDTSTASLQRLLETREKLEIDNVKNEVNWQIISPPQVEKDPIYPYPLYSLALLSLFGGLSLGIISALIIDKLEDSIYTINQIKGITQRPILGTIPHNKNLNSLGNVIFTSFPSFQGNNQENKSLLSQSINNNQTSWFESFNNFYTNIYLLNSDQKINSLVITSPNPEEGKSTISFYLALTMCKIGKKVLLIDGDFRLPQQHQFFALENNQGLKDILTEEIEIESALKTSELWENLSVITAGKNSEEMTHLLHSQKMAKFMENLQQNYDFDLIIFDSPSLLGFSDAKVIASHTDGLIITTKLGKTKRNVLQQAIEQLTVANIPLLGIVANGINNHDQAIYNHSNCQKYYQNNVPLTNSPT